MTRLIFQVTGGFLPECPLQVRTSLVSNWINMASTTVTAHQSFLSVGYVLGLSPSCDVRSVCPSVKLLVCAMLASTAVGSAPKEAVLWFLVGCLAVVLVCTNRQAL